MQHKLIICDLQNKVKKKKVHKTCKHRSLICLFVCFTLVLNYSVLNKKSLPRPFNIIPHRLLNYSAVA